MISNEAIEAATRGIASANLRSRPWDELTTETQNHFRRDARAALEAAAPYMQVGAWGEGDEAWGGNRVAIGDNPFRSKA